MTDSGWGPQDYGQQAPQQGGYQQPGYAQQPSYQDPAAYQQPGYQPPAYQAPGGAVAPYQPAAGGYQQPGAYPGVAQLALYVEPVAGLSIPQGTELAGAGNRVGSFFLSVLAVLICSVTAGLGALAYLIWGIISWGNSQTPTQQVLNLRAWNISAQQRATWGGMFLWAFLRFIINITVVGAIVSFIMMLTSKDARTLYDKAAGIVILRDPNKVLGPARM
jgi:uncharacterized RDD family membrane protein YckC